MMAMHTNGEMRLTLFAASQVHVRLNLEICAERVDYCVTHSGRPFVSRSKPDKCIAYIYICHSILDACDE